MAETRERKYRKYWHRIDLASHVLLVILITLVIPGLFYIGVGALNLYISAPGSYYPSVFFPLLIPSWKIVLYAFMIAPAACVFIPVSYAFLKYTRLTYFQLLTIAGPCIVLFTLLAQGLFWALNYQNSTKDSSLFFEQSFSPLACSLFLGATIAYADASRVWRMREEEKN